MTGSRLKGTKDSWLPATRCSALGTMIKNSYHGIQKAIHPFRFKHFEHFLLGYGGATI